MSPRPGGESDKFGNRYEGAWTIRHVLYVLNGTGASITVEDVGDRAEGAEFTYRGSDGVQVHQLKRQHGTTNSWSVASIYQMGIWANARRHVEAGRAFHFVSTIPAQVPSELCDFARRSNSLKQFIDHWLPNKEVQKAFDELSSSTMMGSADAAWTVLRNMWIRWPDEREVIEGNAALAGLLLEGAAGPLAAVGVGDLVVHSLGSELTASAIQKLLPRYGLRRTTAIRSKAIIEGIEALTAGWCASIEAELLQPVIGREEAATLAHLATTSNGLVFLVGAAGGGKTAALWQAVRLLLARGLPVLAFRLDRLESFSSTVELGTRMGLDVSPAAALAAAAGERPSLLVIDQLDAVSLASGRMPRNFDVVADLIREATAFAGMRVVLASRKFDVDNDQRIRSLSVRPNTETVTVGPLSDDQVNAAVSAMGLDATALMDQQRRLLQSPLHLVLLATVAGEWNALAFQTTGHLFDAYWEHKRRSVDARRRDTRFARVVSRVAEEISKRQRLSVPVTVLDRDDLANDADVLVSEHVLVRDGRQVAFFHEAFFDYAFARHWVSQDQSLVEFLIDGEQELFRRAQVRQIMNHLRESDPIRFVGEIRALLLSEEVRFHIKDAALAVLGGIADPTPIETDMVLDLSARHPPYEARLWSHLRTRAWFTRLKTDGHIAKWLQTDEGQQDLALRLMLSVARTAPDQVAGLLMDHRDRANYSSWLLLCVRYADIKTSRPLFDLYLNAIRCGQYNEYDHDLWGAVHDLEEKHPDWAIEVLVAYLVHRPGALELDDRGRVAALKDVDAQGAEFAYKAAASAPRQFCDALLPYLLRVMRTTAIESDGKAPIPDAHFSDQISGFETDGDLDDALFGGMVMAMRNLVEADPKGMRPTLESLAVDPHESAQWLLYQGLLAGRAAYADWAAELLLEGRHRFVAGYTGNRVWVTRQLLQAITPHIGDDLFSRLEAAVRDVRFEMELPRGWYAFNLLSAMREDRLSEVGRRRLGELRRAVGMEQPPEPEGIVGGYVGPPIPTAAANHMNDDNWLSAMTKHAGEPEDFGSLRGGAKELSQVLREQVKQEPVRFSRLALRLNPAVNTAYGDAILMGLGDAEQVQDAGSVYEAIRHIAALGHIEHDLWLGWALRPYRKTAPLHIVELIRDRLLTTTEPTDDGVRASRQDKSGQQRIDIRGFGINTARGSLAEALADLLIYDVDGSRTAVAMPHLCQMANEPALPVRACLARLMGAAMRHARPTAAEAFWRLIDTDDALLATDQVTRVLAFLGNDAPDMVRPITQRMLASDSADVRFAGGQLATLAAMEWGLDEELDAVLRGTDAAARKGAAEVAAHHLRHTARPDVATRALAALVHDTDDEVRKKAAEVAAALRGHALRPFEVPVRALLGSAAFVDALPQLLITLERAPDRVDDLALVCAQRFVELLGEKAADISTAAAGNSREVGRLIIRGLAQSQKPDERGALLDVLDLLLLTGAYGIDDVVSESERER